MDADLLVENQKLREWLYEDCMCSYVANDVDGFKSIEDLRDENSRLLMLLSEQCSCKG